MKLFPTKRVELYLRKSCVLQTDAFTPPQRRFVCRPFLNIFQIFPSLFAVITRTAVQDPSAASQAQAKTATSLQAAEFFKDSLLSALQILADSKTQPEAIFTICKLAFSQFDKVCLSRTQTLISCCSKLIDLLQNRRFLHRYELALESHLLAALTKHPLVPLAELIVKFTGLASSQFNSSRLMRRVLISSNFTESQQISLMLPIIRHNSFERDFLQILADVLLRRDTDTPIDDCTLEFLAHLVLVRQPPSPPTSNSSIIQPPSNTICLSLASDYHNSDVLQVVRWIIQPISDSRATVKRKLCAALCLPHLRFVHFSY